MPFAFFRAPIRSLAGVATLLALIVAQLLPWPALGPGRAAGAAKTAAIAVPQAPETCPHHPQGCPPDCHCPKIHHDAGEDGAGTLAGPALVRCTALGDSLTPAAPGLFLPPHPPAVRFPDREQALRLSAAQATARGFRPLPAKIPIA